MRSEGSPILNLNPPAGMTRETQEKLLATLKQYNQEHQKTRADNSQLAARIANYELAFRMQTAAPEATDIEDETQETHNLYGLDNERSAKFGRQCLMARRLVERGVRFVYRFTPAETIMMLTGTLTAT